MSVSSSRSQSRTALVILGICVLAILAIVATVIVWRTRLDTEVARQLRAIRADGLPTSGAELNTWYDHVPDGKNAALVITEALALMRTFPDYRSNEIARLKLPRRGDRLSPEQRNLIDEYVELNASALGKAREGITLPKSRYPVNLTPGATASLPHLTEIRRLARVADLEVLLAIEAGKTEDAAKGISLVLGLAHSLDKEPVLMSQLVRAALVKMAIASLERSLATGGFSDAGLSALANSCFSAKTTNLMM